MQKSKIVLYYKNVMAETLGAEHGIRGEQLKVLVEKTSPLIKKLNEERKAGGTAYRELPYDNKGPEAVKALSARLGEFCDNLVVLGIGGSALGNISLQTALNPYMYNLDDKQRKGPRLFVLDNIDPAQMTSFLSWIGDKLDRTVFNVISKSGQTTETLSQFMIIRRMLLDKLGFDEYKKHVVITTEDKQDNTLLKIAQEEEIALLNMPSGVGGRFSVLSVVGLFSAVMCGIDIDQLLAGARDMDARVSCEDFYKNPAAINAAINYYYYNQGKKISVMMPYSYQLKDMADWFRQLWAESLGKANDLKANKVLVGPTPVKALGVTDQHSQIQLYREGPNDKLFTFLHVADFERTCQIGPVPEYASQLAFLAGRDLGTLINNEARATEYALLQSQRPSLTILFDKVNAYTVGQFIYLYEVTTSLAGVLFGINPYDQPAVELGKRATFALMGKSGDEYEHLARQIQSSTDIDTAYLV